MKINALEFIKKNIFFGKLIANNELRISFWNHKRT